MRCRVLLLLPSLLAFAGGCTSVTRTGGSATFDQGTVVDVFVRWREGERRRDPDMAQAALHFENSSDRDFHRDELQGLSRIFAGPIRTAREFHLIGHPDPLGPGDYLFLEPAGHAYAATFVTLVAVNGEPRVLYRRPPLRQERRLAMTPAEAQRTMRQSRIAFWESLDGPALEEEVARTRRLLAYEQEAERYARENSIPLPPFHPSPAKLREMIDPLTPVETRRWVLATLRAVPE